jgi:hypothetical protein
MKKIKKIELLFFLFLRLFSSIDKENTFKTQHNEIIKKLLEKGKERIASFKEKRKEAQIKNNPIENKKEH